jgi:beta-glucosidase/6-phospho-beta-glucosidase/beta-galactosidase
VKWWITFNEPAVFSTGYATAKGFAPSVNAPGIGNYLAVHTMLLAHAKTYHMYKREFWPKQQG